jgi:hypothetical protein
MASASRIPPCNTPFLQAWLQLNSWGNGKIFVCRRNHKGIVKRRGRVMFLSPDPQGEAKAQKAGA